MNNAFKRILKERVIVYRKFCLPLNRKFGLHISHKNTFLRALDSRTSSCYNTNIAEFSYYEHINRTQVTALTASQTVINNVKWYCDRCMWRIWFCFSETSAYRQRASPPI